MSQATENSGWGFPLAFGGIAAAVFLLAAYFAGLLVSMQHGMLLAAAIAIDLTITVPAAFYFLVIRPRELPNVWLAPVVAVCFAAAYLILPERFESPLTYLELAAIPLEIGVVGYIVWRFRKLLGSEAAASSADAIVRLRRVCEEITGSKRIGDLAAGEIAMFWYLVRPPKETAGRSLRFSYHKRSGHVSIVMVLLFLLAVEGTVIHYLLQMISSFSAWLVTATTIYAGLWLLSDLRASVARPVVVEDGRVLVRAGFRFDAEIPAAAIERIANAKPEDRNRPVAAALFGEPTHWIVLRNEIHGEGPYGFTRKADAVGLTPDDPEGFVKAVDELLSEGK